MVLLKRVCMRVLVLVALVLVLPGCARVGEAMFRADMAVEAAIYGLKTHSVDAGGVHFVYYEGGKYRQAPATEVHTLVLIHGYSADRHDWLRFARHFTGGPFRVLIPDLPGHGESSYDPKASYDIPSQVARLHAFLQKVGARHVDLVGNSMGGHIAALYTLTYPGDVDSLALFDASGVTSPKQSPMMKQIAQGHNPFFVNNYDQFVSFLHMAMQDPPWLPSPVLHALAARYEKRQPRLRHIWNDIVNSPPLDKRLGEIHAPTLVLWGAADQLLDMSMASVYAGGIAGAQKVIMPGTGHLPMIEKPAKTAEIYRQFLQRVIAREAVDRAAGPATSGG